MDRHIRFEQGTDERGRPYLDCTDNGVGMGVREVSEVFAQAGVRLGDLAEFLEELSEWARLDPPVRLFTNSRFGIGVLSYFMIAEELTVWTCQMDRHGLPGPRLQVSVAGPGSLFRIRQLGPGAEPGTTVRLQLRAANVSCVDTLSEVLWVTDFETEANDGKRRRVWPAGELSAAAGPAHADRGGVVADTTAGVWWCRGDGALLADGLWAGTELPGAVVNLREERAPCLSVDRIKILGYREEDVDALLWQAIPALIAAGAAASGEDPASGDEEHGARRARPGVLSYKWLCAFAGHRPLIADAIFEQALAAGVMRWKLRGKPVDASVVGCFAPDAENPSGPDALVEWRLTALAAAGLYAKQLTAGVDWRRVARARPSDALLLSADLDGKAPWLDPVTPVPARHLLTVARPLGRSPGELVARLGELGYNTAPEHDALQPGPHDLVLISCDLDGRNPWLDPAQPVRLPRLLVSAAKTGMTVADVASRLRQLGFTVTAEGLAETDARDLELISPDGDETGPDPDEPIGLGQLLRTAARIGMPSGEAAIRLRRLGYTVWVDVDALPVSPQIEPTDVVLVSRDADGTEPWLGPTKPISAPHLVRCSSRTGLSVRDVAVRLRQFGFTVRVDPDRLPDGEPDGADLVMTSVDLDGEHLWLSENEPVPLAHMVLAGHRLGRAPSVVAARLASMGYAVGAWSDHLDSFGIDADDLVIISRDLDGKGPWLDADKPVPILHLLKAAEVTGSWVDEVAARLTGLGFQIPADQFAHLTERVIGHVDADDTVLLSEGLDGEQPWLDATRPVPMMHLLRAAKAVDRDVAEIVARLIVLGYTVHGSEAGLGIDRKTREDLLVVASSDLDGEEEFLDPDEQVPLGHVLKAARRVGCSAEQVTAWLRQLGYRVDDPPSIPPDGIRSADITLLSKDLDGEGPWLDLDRRVPLGHVFAAARTLRRPIEEVRARLDQYGMHTADPSSCLPRLRPGGAWHPLVGIAAADLPQHVSQLGQAAGRADNAWIGRVLRDAVTVSLLSTRRPNADVVDALRRLAASYDQWPQHVADSHEVNALIFGGARHRHLAWFAEGIDRLAGLERFEPPLRDDGQEHGTPLDLAAMVDRLAGAGLGAGLGASAGVLLQLAANLHKLDLSGAPLERILAQLISVSLVDNHRGLAAGLLPLVPEPVTFDLLAFNLACLHARYGDRHGALRHTRVALELGRSPDQFMSDDSFVPLRSDHEFVALLDEYR